MDATIEYAMREIFQPLNTNDALLKPTRIDIFQYSLTNEWNDAFELLSSDERERANRFHFPRHKRRFVVARAMMRLILGRYLNARPYQLEFTYNAYGKPGIAHPSGLEFNISHSGELAILAVGQKHSLGIDLEFFSARPYAGIGKQLFSSLERDTLANLPAMLTPLAFFHIWAQKEAFIKASGLGLHYPTEQFDVPALPLAPKEIRDSIHNTSWQLLSFMPQVACCAALCHHKNIQEIRYGLVNCP